MTTQPWPDFDQPKRYCRICGDESDAASAMDGKRGPRNGDVSICINCGAISIFEGDHFRAPTDDERLDLPTEAISAITFIKARGRIRG